MTRPTRPAVAGRVCVLLCALGLAANASACVFKYGSSPDSLGDVHTGSHWDHGFMGDDWDGVDGGGKPWMCMSGKRQSPISVPALVSLDGRIPRDHQTRWSYPNLVSNGSNIEVINTGHAIQVEWLSPYAAEVKIAVPANRTNATRITDVVGMNANASTTSVKAVPIQFHFHSASEHLMSGKYFPLELHIVHLVTDLPACTAGCYSVTGVLFELSAGPDNPLLEAIWANMPLREGEIKYLPSGAEVPLGKMLPRPNVRDYVTYEGSLTTPPCTEGLLWHVMTKTQTISQGQWRQYQTAIGLKECTARNGTAAEAHKPAHSRRHHHRRMLEEEEPVGNPDDYTCEVVAYGSNFRSSQLINGRLVKLALAA